MASLARANSRVSGLREVCALAALLLSVDCLLLCTYLLAVLCVMIEVRLFFSDVIMGITGILIVVSRWNELRTG
jgi:hypothetical protein